MSRRWGNLCERGFIPAAGDPRRAGFGGTWAQLSGDLPDEGNEDGGMLLDWIGLVGWATYGSSEEETRVS